MGDNLQRREWATGEYASWIADKIVGANQYGNDAATLLRAMSETLAENKELKRRLFKAEIERQVVFEAYDKIKSEMDAFFT